MIRAIFSSLVIFALLILASIFLTIPKTTAADVCYSNSVDVVLVIDRSGSMNGTKIEDAKIAAKRFLTVIQENDTKRLTRVGIVSYAQTSTIDEPLTDNFYLLNDAINNITANNSTCIECGIADANTSFYENGRSGVPKIVILLTDGKANAVGGRSVDNATAEQAALNELNNSPSGTTFYTIGLGSDVNESFLQLIASTTNGTYYNSPTSSELGGIYESLANEILPSGLITGVIFEDINGNGVYDYPTDNRLPYWQLNLTDSSGTIKVTSDANGVYTTNLLCDGPYTLELIPRGGYIQTVPLDGNVSVTVSGSELTGYNFGVIKDIKPLWIQGIGGDMRINQKLNSNIPKDEYLSVESDDPEMHHGVVFGAGGLVLGGNKQQKSNESGWYVSDADFSFIVTTSYSNMLAVLTRGGALANAKTIFGDACVNTNPNCTLIENLESGIYLSDSSVVINNNSSYSFASGKNYIFLINGTLRIDSDIIVPKDSTVMFIASEKIIIDRNVTRLQGIYTAGDEFRAEGCMCDEGDEQLVIEGSIVANTAMVPNSISFTNIRDLKLENEDTPSVLIKYRPDFVLNAPDIFRYKSYTIREVAPGS